MSRWKYENLQPMTLAELREGCHTSLDAVINACLTTHPYADKLYYIALANLLDQIAIARFAQEVVKP